MSPVQRIIQFNKTFKNSVVDRLTFEIKTVIFTHLHWDHCHNAAYLKNAEFYVQKKELQYAINPIVWPEAHLNQGFPGSNPPWFDIFDRLKIVDGDIEILPGLNYIA